MGRLLTTRTVCLGIVVLMAGCSAPKDKVPPSPPGCTDGAKNGDETDADCGGPTCGKCADSRACVTQGDCVSGVCSAGTCAAASCTDSVKNGDETDADCGGSCPKCADTMACVAKVDCKSGLCINSQCAAATCLDGVKNTDESDVDCGGSSCLKCADARACSAAGDCQSGVCTSSVCQAPNCVDAAKNGDETDADCGGATCPKCAASRNCKAGADCASGVCNASGACAIASCTDSTKNGGETDADCGGSSCPKCADAKACAGAGDCLSGVCTGNACQVPSCSDGVKNGGETDSDCGGTCSKCADTRACAAATDCQSGICLSNQCAAATCVDGVKNTDETDADCGGTTCPKCADARLCATATDCSSGVCTANVCAAPTCTDNIKNGSETDADCGGASCAGCGTTKACLVGRDCLSGTCSTNVCQPSCPDGLKNGDETDVDCGGASCGSCGAGRGCLLARDCRTGSCNNQICRTPDPSTLAPPLDSTVATSIADSTAFLYTGPSAIQTGVATNAIEKRRVSILRGKVLDRAGAPIADVAVTIRGHSEYGVTHTRADGMFDLAVNGGGLLAVDYAKSGLLPLQRKVNAPWLDYVLLPDVVMIAVDTKVTTITLPFATGFQVAQANAVTDSSGTRQLTMLFAPGTQATMTVGKAIKALPTLNVRATEYTVGDSGPAAMPATLPATSAYTYAVELSADEAIAAGATSVNFTKPVILHLDNFLHMSVGGVVPTGYYDRLLGQWIASKNGLVIKVLSITAGMADLDVSGAGTAASTATLTALGITDAERQQLANLYQAGASLWRVTIDHFTPCDMNWPYFAYAPGLSTMKEPPPVQQLPEAKEEDPCKQPGSIIGCQDQTLGEAIGVRGTPFFLAYQSDRVAGRKRAFAATFPVSGATVPANLKRIDVQVCVAGRCVDASLPPQPNQTYAYTWDGKDAYGRQVQGPQRIFATIAYIYPGRYGIPPSNVDAFGELPVPSMYGIPASLDLARGEVVLRRGGQLGKQTVGEWDNRRQGLGGWSLSPHHLYDHAAGVLYQGDGRKRSSGSLPPIITTVAGGGSGSGTAGAATGAFLYAVHGVSVGPDGSLYFTTTMESLFLDNHSWVRRVGPDGMLSVLAGTGTDGVLWSPGNASLAEDGSLYIADTYNNVIRRVSPSGVMTTVAGTGTRYFSGDGGRATLATFRSPQFVLAAADGGFYVSDTGNQCVRRVNTNGTISTIAGGGPGTAMGGAATDIYLQEPRGLVEGPDGSLYIADMTSVYRVATNGVITRVVGQGGSASSSYGDGGLATAAGTMYAAGVALGPDGTLYLSEGYAINRIRQVTPDGIISTLTAGVSRPNDLAVGPDGNLYIADWINNRILCIGPPPVNGTAAGDTIIPSEDGRELFFFNSVGRHQKTLDAWSGLLRYRFAYDAAGQLASITDGDGAVTSIERDAGGMPTAIVAAGGQRTVLSLDSNGYLASIADPAGLTTQLAHTSDGLLTQLTDPRSGLHRFTYDSLGRLAKDQNPAGGFTALARVEDVNGAFTVTATSATGLARSYQSANAAAGGLSRVTTAPGGAKTSSAIGSDGSHTVTSPDGTVTTMRLSSDPRWGMRAPLTSGYTVRTPSGLTSSLTGVRTTTLSNPTDLLSLTALSDVVTINGRAFTTDYDAVTKKLTNRSPAGRTAVRTLDAKDKLVRIESAATVAAATFAYDIKGQVTQMAQGTQSSDYGYDAKGRIITRTDALGGILKHGWDDSDRMISNTLPSGRTFGFTYDANGNRTGVTTPSGAVHQLSYTATDLISGYAPPQDGGYSFDYNLDGQLTRATFPSGRTADVTYDTGGRMTGRSIAEASTAITYGDATTRVSSITRTEADGGVAEGLAYTYDGSLVKSVSFSGPATGTFAYRYDNNFFLVGTKLDTAAETLIARDADGLLTGYGTFAWTRAGPSGATTKVTDGTLAVTYAHDNLGRVQTRTDAVGVTQLYQEQLTFDSVGRISKKVELVAGSAHTLDYTYDADSRLLKVSRDGTVVEQYAYDVNGNRTSVTRGAATAEVSTYDTIDRLQLRGGLAYAFDVDGFLTRRGTDAFVYSVRGELLSFTSGSVTVRCGYDGLGRRTSRTAAGGTTQYLYGNPDNAFQVTHTRDGAGVLTSYFYDEEGRLTSFDRGATRYYVGADAVGTPRIVSTSAGAVVKTLDYDAFGEVLADSAPTFDLPIGFAGGIWDADSRLVRFGLRDYDPAAGRWTARDPLLFEGADANLYAYVTNNPISLRDPSGLISVNVSAFMGIGAGASFAVTTKGISACVEAGVGLGESIGFDLGGGLEQSGVALKASAKVEAGMLSAELKGKIALSECGDLSTSLKADFGAATLTASADLLGNTQDVSVENFDKGKKSMGSEGKLKTGLTAGASAQVKASAQACKQLRW